MNEWIRIKTFAKKKRAVSFNLWVFGAENPNANQKIYLSLSHSVVSIKYNEGFGPWV